MRRGLIPLTEAQAKIYKNPSGDPRGRWRVIPMTAQGFRANQMYDIATPGGVTHRPPEGRCWSMIKPEYEKLLTEGRIWFGKDNKSQPGVIRYLSEVDGIGAVDLVATREAGHTDEAVKKSRPCSEPRRLSTPKASAVDGKNPPDCRRPQRSDPRFLRRFWHHGSRRLTSSTPLTRESGAASSCPAPKRRPNSLTRTFAATCARLGCAA